MMGYFPFSGILYTSSSDLVRSVAQLLSWLHNDGSNETCVTHDRVSSMHERVRDLCGLVLAFLADLT